MMTKPKKGDEIDRKLDQAEELVLGALRVGKSFLEKSVKHNQRIVGELDRLIDAVKRIRADLKPVPAPSHPTPKTPKSHGD